ncbi:MAG: transglycosylase domain-containing protein, partial [Acidobacteria bacterium]|nr:transglycosylase domain-containing protein [Acidobacteriota bacterium]
MLISLGTVGALAMWLRLGPLPANLLNEAGSTSTVVVDRNGVPLYEALSGEGTRSVKLTSATLPPHLVAAAIAAEDRRFWWHPGVDPVAMLRAARTNLAERRVVEGGSTISQQVAKLLLNRRSPRRTRTWSAKIHEAVVALRLEHRLTKRELLAMYLNLAGYGNQIVGVERAGRAYFGTPASMLTPAQAALLAGLPQRPSGFNPYR